MRKGNNPTTMQDLADEFMQHSLMEETAHYIRRGRQHTSLPLPDVNIGWICALRDWILRWQSGGDDDSRDELRLRGLEPPYASVQSEIAAMHAEVAKLAPDAPASESLKRQMAEFFEQRAKPKN
jgi:hypothetical protein